MQRTKPFSRGLGFTSLCLLLLSALNTTFAAPIPSNGDGANALVARGDDVYSVTYTDANGQITTSWYEKDSVITQAEYEEYLDWNYKNKDKYVRLNFRLWASLQ